jgi:glycosyltransferase involved in cell wall biosynthesis
LKILYLHQYYCPPGGWGNDRSAEFAYYWQAAGHTVTVLTSNAYFPPDHVAHKQAVSQFVTENGVTVIVLRQAYEQSMNFWQRVRAFWGFYRLLIRHGKKVARPDIIYASSTPPTVAQAGKILAAYFRCNWIFETVDVWPDVPVGMKILRNRLLINLLHTWVNRLYHNAKAVVALSEGMKKQILSHGIPANKIHVIVNGTNTERFCPPAVPPAAPIIALYAGSVGKANGVSFLITIARYITYLPAEKQIEIRIAGFGSELADLKQAIAAGKLSNIRIIKVIPKHQMPQLLQRVHIGLITFAPFEVLEANSANKFFDYLAAGLPVIINYGGWQADVLNEYQCGFSAPSAEMFAQRLIQLASDEALRNKMGINARRLARAQYHRKDLAAKALEILLAHTKNKAPG